MKNKLTLIALALMAMPLYAAVRAHFPDGTDIEIFTQTTGATKIDSSGSIGLLKSDATRMIMGQDSTILFGYTIQASRGASPDTVKITIGPISPADQEEWLHDGYPFHADGPHFPTVAAVREFPSIKIGEVLTLDVLQNPSTGEKIYDVLRPVIENDPEISPSATAVYGAHVQPISLKQIAVRINGASVAAPASWIVGSAVRIEIPGHGAAILSTQNPRSDAAHPFTIAAHADGNTLSWKSGTDRIEIVSETNILTQSTTGDLWVWFDAGFRSPGAVRLQAADSVEPLLSKPSSEPRR